MSSTQAAPSPAAPEAEPVELTDLEREILTFEAGWWKHQGAKEQAVRDLFGLSSTRYYQLLHDIIDKPAALVYDPMLIKRLRRLRESRQQRRSARHLTL